MNHLQHLRAAALLLALAGCASTGRPIFQTTSGSPETGEAKRTIASAGELDDADLPVAAEQEESITSVHLTSAAGPLAPLPPEGTLEYSFASAAEESVPSPEPPHRSDYSPVLDELVAYALANNPEVQAAHMQAHAASERVPQAWALDDPMLMTNAFLEPVQTAAGPQDVILGLSQKFPWFGKRGLRASVAYRDAQAAFAQMAATQLAAVEQVKLVYFELYFLDRALEVNRELEERLEDVIEIARVKYETAQQTVGLESILQAQVELARLETMRVELEQARVREHARLARVLHAPSDRIGYVEPTITPSRLPQSAETLVALIDECQPELRAVQQELGRDRAAISLAEKSYFPDVTAGLNWHAIGPTGLSAAATGEDAFALVMNVNLPIYRGKLDAALREAEFNAARSARRYEATWDEVRAEVQTLHAQAVEHDRIVQILDADILPKAAQALALSLDAYRVDRITFQQLIENYNALLRLRVEYHRRLSQREKSLAQLERAVGCAIMTWPAEPPTIPSDTPL